jgi:transcriptional regulator with XRE-family HTH domain
MTGRDVCKRLRQIRFGLGLTQQQFADRVDQSVESIGKIERGTNIPTLDTLYKIAASLNIPIGEIVSPRGRVRSKPVKALVEFQRNSPLSSKRIPQLVSK